MYTHRNLNKSARIRPGRMHTWFNVGTVLTVLLLKVNLGYTLTVSNVSVTPPTFDPSKNETVTIAYTLAQVQNATVDVEVYAGTTTLINSIKSTSSIEGINTVTWNGRDSVGSVSPSGNYTVKVVAKQTGFQWLTTGTMTQPQEQAMGIAVNKRIGSAYYHYVYVTRRTGNRMTDGGTTDGGSYIVQNSTYTLIPGQYGDGNVRIYRIIGSTTVSDVGTVTAPATLWDDLGPVKVYVDDEDYVYVGDWLQFSWSRGDDSTIASTPPGNKQQNLRIWRFNPDGSNPTEVLSYTVNKISNVTLGFRVTGTGANKVMYLGSQETTTPRIRKYTVYNQSTGKWTSTSADQTIDVSTAPADLCLDATGNIYVCFGNPYGTGITFITSNVAVAKYNSTGTKLWERTFTDLGGLTGTTGAAYGCTGIDYNAKDGNLYVNNTGAIAILTQDGTVIERSVQNFYAPNDLKVDDLGRIYVVNQDESIASGVWKVRSSTYTTVTQEGSAAVTIGMISQSPVTGRITVNQNPPGTPDTIQGTAGAVSGNSLVEIFKDTGLTVRVSSTTAASDGSFGPLNIGDNVTATVYLTVTEPGKGRSLAIMKANDYTAGVIQPTSTQFVVYPNPYIEKQHEPRKRTGAVGITFTGLPTTGKCDIKIYTLTGETVFAKLGYSTTDGYFDWDTKNEAKEKVATGVYLYHVKQLTGGKFDQKGKLAIIR